MKIRPWPEVLEVIPRLSTQELEMLGQSLKAHQDGYQPILVLPDGRIIDGHHRWELSKHKHSFKVVDLPEDVAFDLALRLNMMRRQLSREQMREMAQKLRALGKTQEEVADLIGKAQQTIGSWESSQNGTNTKNGNGSGDINIPDYRIKVPAKERGVIYKRHQAGETQEQIAADYKVSRKAISKIISAEEKRIREREARETLAQSYDPEAEFGIFEGDFREIGVRVADNSVDLIFTDPPYNKDAIQLYGDLAIFAKRVLRTGGICMAYSGQAFLPAVLNVMGAYLSYMWTCEIRHSGGDLRFRKYKILNGWKPIVAFYKPELNVWWDWFADSSNGGKEKGLHEWQQAEAEAAHYIRSLCPTGGVVLDPFVGSGTTCAAAKSLGMKYIGFEVVRETFLKALERVQNVGK